MGIYKYSRGYHIDHYIGGTLGSTLRLRAPAAGCFRAHESGHASYVDLVRCLLSATRFPAVIQPVVRALPLTAAIDALRGNMQQGMNLGQLIAPIAILFAWLAVPFVVALRIFRWR
jgi:hypothetical protein